MLRNFFKDDQGHVVIAQWPNRPLWIAIFCFALQYFPHPLIKAIGSWGLIISLLYWSYLEIFYGVNSWRRFLGVAVALSQIIKVLLFFRPAL